MATFSCKESKVTEKFEGYELIEKRFVKEVNADVYYLKHIKSGGHVVKIAADDKNKTFGIGFKTEPNSDCGTPHIIEHSVLNGSKKYPVKSPFDILGKTSLKTFLNAMTGSDLTLYPVASMNEKDYFNLMDVYLDAVFFPLMYEDERILKQEGWHYELADKDSPIVYKGVVYNEMKGAFSSPERELGYQIDKALFPDNGYGMSSGGYPQAITDLSQEDFIAFHKENYHPTNSCIYIYGDADIKKELAVIDKDYLSKFDSKDGAKKEIAKQKPFTEMKVVSAPYSVMEGAPTENQTFLNLSFVYGDKTDPVLSMALDILSDVLVDQESAPVRTALQEAGIGRDVYSYNSSDNQNTFIITVLNANAEDRDKFKEIVFDVFKNQIEKGVDKNAVDAYINRMEFRLREGDNAQKGLMCSFRSFPDWMFTNDPFVGLEWEKTLASLRKKMEENYLETILKDAFLNNNHALLISLEPKPGLEKEITAKTAEKLAEYKKTLTDEQIDALVKDTKELIEYQRREDTPEALATIPKLERSDLNPEVDWYEITKKEEAGTDILHYEDFANGIVYANLMFDLKALPEELVPYASFMTSLLGKMDTENHKYGDLEKEIRKNTGTFYSNLDFWKENYDDNKLLTKYIVVSKAVPEKTDKMFELINEVLFSTKFEDKERLKVILTRLQSRLESRVKNRGLNYAITRTFSYYSNSGMFNELTDGFEYYWFINELLADFDTKSDEIVANIKKTAELLFNKNNLITGTTCSKENYESFTKSYSAFAGKLPSADVAANNWEFDLSPKNEGFMSASKVQYVVKAYNFRKLGYEWDGKMRVLNNILSNDYLHNQIRVIGGAYGGFSGIMDNGTVYFGSYRDPNLKETLDNYDGSPEFIEKFEADEEEMLGYIIGAVSELDSPRTPSQKGERAYARYFRKYTKDMLVTDRKGVLSTTVEDIKAMSGMIKKVLEQNVHCVYGNKEKVTKNKSLFGKILSLDKSL